VKREFRLTRTSDFKRVRREGRSYAHPLLVLIVKPGSISNLRIGVTTSHAVGNAVNRNRAKRRVRACLDKFIPLISPDYDLIVLARPPLISADFLMICRVMRDLLERAGVMLKPGVPHGEDGIGLPE
jgi:ribonuclease P protein component